MTDSLKVNSAGLLAINDEGLLVKACLDDIKFHDPQCCKCGNHPNKITAIFSGITSCPSPPSGTNGDILNGNTYVLDFVEGSCDIDGLDYECYYLYNDSNVQIAIGSDPAGSEGSSIMHVTGVTVGGTGPDFAFRYVNSSLDCEDFWCATDVASFQVVGNCGSPIHSGYGGTCTFRSFEYTDWVISTVYAVDDLVVNDGVYYICIQGNTATSDNEPGVGVDWETHWAEVDC